jgi:hypothetical protein
MHALAEAPDDRDALTAFLEDGRISRGAFVSLTDNPRGMCDDRRHDRPPQS